MNARDNVSGSSQSSAASASRSLLERKNSEELIEIILNNNGLWGSNAIDTIKQILTARGVDLPRQPSLLHSTRALPDDTNPTSVARTTYVSLTSVDPRLSTPQTLVAMLFLGALGIAVGIFLSPLVVSAAKFIADSPHFGNFARAGGAVTAVIIAPCLPYVFLGFAVTIVTRFSANSRATRPVLALALSLCIAIIAVHALSPLAEITRMSMGYKGPVQSNFRMGFAIFNSVFGIPIMLVLAAKLGTDVAALIRRRTPQNSCGKIQP